MTRRAKAPESALLFAIRMTAQCKDAAVHVDDVRARDSAMRKAGRIAGLRWALDKIENYGEGQSENAIRHRLARLLPKPARGK